MSASKKKKKKPAARPARRGTRVVRPAARGRGAGRTGARSPKRVAADKRKTAVPKPRKKAAAAPKPRKKIAAPKPRKKIAAPKPRKKIAAPKPRKKIAAPKPRKKVAAPKRKKIVAPKQRKKIAAPKQRKKAAAPKQRKKVATPKPRKRAKKPASRVERLEQKARAAEARAREHRKKLEEARRKIRRKLAATPAVKKSAATIAERIRDFLSNVVYELQLNGVTARYRVTVNGDRSIDAEIHIVFTAKINTVDRATDILNIVEESMEQIPAQWISVGFTLKPRANAKGVLKSAQKYLPYQGELRLSPNYYKTENQALSFQVAYEVLRNVTNAHGMLPTGMLIRLAWSPDGRLRRVEDYVLRKGMRKERKEKP